MQEHPSIHPARSPSRPACPSRRARGVREPAQRGQPLPSTGPGRTAHGRPRRHPRTGALHHRLHPDVRRLVDVRHPRQADQLRVRALRGPALVDHRRGGAQRLAVAAASWDDHRPHRRPEGDDLPAARLGGSGLPGVEGRLLRHAGGPRVLRRVRRQLLQRRHRVELGLAATRAPRIRPGPLRRRQRRRLGHQVRRPTADRRDDRGSDLPGHLPWWMALRAGAVRRAAGADGSSHVVPRTPCGPDPGRLRSSHATAGTASAAARLALRHLLRRLLRGLRRSRGVAAHLLPRQLRRHLADGRPPDGHLHLPGLAVAPGRRVVLRQVRGSTRHVLGTGSDAGQTRPY